MKIAFSCVFFHKIKIFCKPDPYSYVDLILYPPFFSPLVCVSVFVPVLYCCFHFVLEIESHCVAMTDLELAM